MRKRNFLTVISILAVSCLFGACQSIQSQSQSSANNAANDRVNQSSDPYSWVKVTDKAEYKTGYNYPLYSIKNKLWAFHAEEIFNSADNGKTWQKAKLPSIRRNVYEAQYARFGDAVYAFGRNTGNYEKISFKPVISRTTDLEKWEVLSEKSNLPGRIFVDIVEFKGKLWLLGGFDGKTYYNDVWNSTNGVKWTRVVEKAPWIERNTYGNVIVFKDKMFLINGGKIDTPPEDDIWSSEDGAGWTEVSTHIYDRPILGGTPVVFDDKLWLLGINRNDTFSNGMLVSGDGKNWREQSADWTPRGGIAATVHDDKLFMTGGKYSVTENGQIRFIYSNDVWYMTRAGK